MEARYAAFGKQRAFRGQVVNVPPVHAPEAQLAGHGQLAGKVVLFNVNVKARCRVNDLCVVCAVRAAEAQVAAAMFILNHDDWVIAEGGSSDLDIPVVLLRQTEGMMLFNWVNPPVNMNAASIVVQPWKPPWFADGASKTNWREFEDAAQAALAAESAGRVWDEGGQGEVGETRVDVKGATTAQEDLIEFWKWSLDSTEVGQEWLTAVRHKVHQTLNIPFEHTFAKHAGGSLFRPKPVAAQYLEGETQGETETRVLAVGEQGQKHNGEDENVFTRMPSVFERVPSFVRRTSSAGFDMAKGTLLQMAQTESGIVRIAKPLALLICNSQHMMPDSSGSSRDLPGFGADVSKMEAMLPTLGFRVLPTSWNKNADQVRLLLRQVQKGFQKGGALSFHDSLLIVLTGHCDGQNVECSMDSSGQTGAIGISILLSYFTDQNAPALQGKLKLFVFGLCMGHPVNMPSGPASLSSSSSVLVADGKERGSTPAMGSRPAMCDNTVPSVAAAGHHRNILNSVSTGGQARVYLSEGQKRAELVENVCTQQDSDSILRSEGVEFQDHVTLSYRQEPLSGTFWSKSNPASTGVLIIDLGQYVEDIDTFSIFQLPFKDAKSTSLIMQRAGETLSSSATPPDNLEWIDVTDARGNVDWSLFDHDTSLGGPSGSIMQASRVFKVPRFSTRWLKIELQNDGTYGCQGGVGLRQIKAFSAPMWAPVAVHDASVATWIDNPSAAAAGPALNRVGADSIQPVYVMPDIAFTGAAKSVSNVIGLPADYSLMTYSVPTHGVSQIPKSGSSLLTSLVHILQSAHHKHTLQDMLSKALQDLVDQDCAARCAGGYGEVVRLLQKRCNEEDFPVMFDMGASRGLSYGIAGPTVRNTDMGAPYEFRQYHLDEPEPRNIERNRAVAERLKARSSMPVKQLQMTFHHRLKSPSFHLSHGNVTLTKSAKSRHPVAACSLQIPPSIKRLSWDIRVGALEVLDGDALAVPHLRVGVVRQNRCHDINFDDYLLGADDQSWAVQTGSLALYKVHNGQRDKASGVGFNKGDVVTMQLDLDKQTLAFTVNDVEFVAPFFNVRGPVIPAISTDEKTVCRLTLDNCRHW